MFLKNRKVNYNRFTKENKGVCMYESYPWPGAHTLSDEVKLLTKWIKELFDGIIVEIQKKELNK